jgi:hypothetical protein
MECVALLKQQYKTHRQVKVPDGVRCYSDHMVMALRAVDELNQEMTYITQPLQRSPSHEQE